MDNLATLNVTYNGQNGTYPDQVISSLSDEELKRVAMEALQTGFIPGISAIQNVDLNDFVVDRFESTKDLPTRIFIRPKTPFGQAK